MLFSKLLPLVTGFLLTRNIPQASSSGTSASLAIIPNTITKQAAIAQFVSGTSGFDGPKVTHNNATSFDWWYFDAVSATDNQSLVIVLFVATNQSFIGLPSSTSILSALVVGGFADGTNTVGQVDDASGLAGAATIATVGDGASGVWLSTGFSFTGSSDLSTYKVTIANSAVGIYGTLLLESVAPAHYPCGPNIAGQTLEVSPKIGWANALPDANATVNMVVKGRTVKFSGGIGYHDKNWSPQPFIQNVDSWYWGHARLGPYSIVWFDVLHPNGTEYVSGYVAKGGKILKTTCSGVKVRPTGAGSTYPPDITTPLPTGYHIEINLGSLGVFKADVVANVLIAEAGVYERWVGTISGGIVGGPTYVGGRSIYEQFRFEGL